MRTRYRLSRRGCRGDKFYCVDTQTGKRTSLRTKNEGEANQLVHSKNEAFRQPMLNLQMARTYLSATDPEIGRRTWQAAMDEMAKSKTGPTLIRHQRAMLDHAFDLILHKPILETQPNDFLMVLEKGTVSTSVYLRRINNFALDMAWLPWAVLPKKRWPKIRFKAKRAVTLAEHQAIVAHESNPERRAYYECCWHLGGAQTDIANLTAKDIDWQNKIVSFHRQKTGTPSIIRFGSELEAVLRSLPHFGPLFPNHRQKRETHRSCEFARCCQRLGFSGITLHSYRYAWAERAKTCGYPERFAQEALGHNSKAVHRAYAKNARVILPALEEYERIRTTCPALAAPSIAAV